MGRRSAVLVVATALLVGLVGLAVVAGRPLGASDPREAASRYESEQHPDATVTVLLDQPWGQGRHVLIRTRRDQRTYLSVSVVSDHGRGWRVTRRAIEQSDPSDVVVGSLLLASSEGDEEHPPWTAVFGELADPGIGRVEVVWSDGTTSAATASSPAYLVVASGLREAVEVRFQGPDGAEVARVPVSEPEVPASEPEVPA